MLWVGCGDEAGSKGPGSGTLAFYLVCDAGLVLGDVVYEITGNGIETIIGTMQPSDDNSPVSVSVNLGEGDAYLLRIKTHVIQRGDASAGDTGTVATCLTSARFNIREGRTTHLRVVFQCEELTDDFDFDSGVESTWLGGKDATVFGPDDDAQVEEDDANAPDAFGANQQFTQDPGTATTPNDAGNTTVVPPVEDSGHESGEDAGHGNNPYDPVGTPSGPCEACSMRACGMTAELDRNVDCYMKSGDALVGPAMGQAKATLCSGLVDCAHETRCALDHVEDCYCGAGMTTQSCLMDGPQGACLGEFEAAAESSDPREVLSSLNSPTLAIYGAAALLKCEAEHCSSECFPAPSM